MMSVTADQLQNRSDRKVRTELTYRHTQTVFALA